VPGVPRGLPDLLGRGNDTLAPDQPAGLLDADVTVGDGDLRGIGRERDRDRANVSGMASVTVAASSPILFQTT